MIVEVASSHHILLALSALKVILLHETHMNVQWPIPVTHRLVLDAGGHTEPGAEHAIGESVAQGGTLGYVGRRGDGRVEGGGWEGSEAGEGEG